MKNFIMILISFFLVNSCSQNVEQVKKNSLDDVYFYLSNYFIVKNTNQIKLDSFIKTDREEYKLTYKINSNENLWIIHYYNESKHLSFFIYKESNILEKTTDSINELRIKQNYYPLHKRWKWIITAPDIQN